MCYLAAGVSWTGKLLFLLEIAAFIVPSKFNIAIGT